LEQALLVKMLRPLPHNARLQYWYFSMSLVFAFALATRFFMTFSLGLLCQLYYRKPNKIARPKVTKNLVFGKKGRPETGYKTEAAVLEF